MLTLVEQHIRDRIAIYGDIKVISVQGFRTIFVEQAAGSNDAGRAILLTEYRRADV